MLRSRRTRREEPLDTRLPDPIVDRADGIGPENEALLADSGGIALLVVLETLTPAERLAYVLHDMRPGVGERLARARGYGGRTALRGSGARQAGSHPSGPRRPGSGRD